MIYLFIYLFYSNEPHLNSLFQHLNYHYHCQNSQGPVPTDYQICVINQGRLLTLTNLTPILRTKSFIGKQLTPDKDHGNTLLDIVACMYNTGRVDK